MNEAAAPSDHAEALAALRTNYQTRPFSRESLQSDPLVQFRKWMDEAIEAELVEPNAMTLATVDAAGKPSQRTVLLKALDDRGFVFYTNTSSRKARQILSNCNVALHFQWLPLARQVSIEGPAIRVSWQETARYFLSRPLGSRIGAWVSPQSSVISSRQILERQFEAMLNRFSNGGVPLPPEWGGFRVRPTSMEFWQGGENRLHDRFRYTLTEAGSWQIDRLAP